MSQQIIAMQFPLFRCFTAQLFLVCRAFSQTISAYVSQQRDATRHKWMAWCVLACGKMVHERYKKKIPYTNTHDAKYYVVLRGIEISYVHNDFLVQFSLVVQFACRFLCSSFFVLFSLALHRSILTFASWVCAQWRKVRYSQGDTQTHTEQYCEHLCLWRCRAGCVHDMITKCKKIIMLIHKSLEWHKL